MPILASLNAKIRSKSPFSIGELFSIISEFTVDCHSEFVLYKSSRILYLFPLFSEQHLAVFQHVGARITVVESSARLLGVGDLPCLLRPTIR